MAGVADKARFHLERAVPELREFEEKELFSQEEIRTLVHKRTDYEYKVLAPRVSPADFLDYAAWEQSLDALRAKRARRLKVSSSSSHASHARTFNIFERAVMKHPGDVSLWRAYLGFAAKVRASKRWRKTMVRALKMHPRDAGLWIIAGRKAARDGDMYGARTYFLRGCRFCVEEPELWIEYATCEMEWLQKLDAKRRRTTKSNTTALEAIRASEAVGQEGDFIAIDDSRDDDDDIGPLLPDVGPQDDKERRKMLNEEAVKKFDKSPALEGAIPLAIFEEAKKQPFFKPSAAEAFFDLFAAFIDVSAQQMIVQKTLDTMQEMYPDDPATCSCLIRQPLIGVEAHSAELPRALRESLGRLGAGIERTSNRKALATKTIAWIRPILCIEDLDDGVRTVLEHTKGKLEEL